MRAGREVVQLLAGIAKERHVAVLISAHEMNPLLPVLDRIVYLAAGRAASGTTAEVVRADVLSELYGSHVDVLNVHGRVLVVAGAGPSEAIAAFGIRPPPKGTLPISSRVRSIPAAVTSSSEVVGVALLVGTIVAVVSGTVGVFTVLRSQSFAGEALGDVNTTGGSAAYLAGVAPLWGFVAVGVAAAGAMELIGIQRARGRTR